jgi:pimeloyl-ACP methyl ester carboxylesterase
MGDKTAVIGDTTRHDGIKRLLDRIANGEDGPMEGRLSQMLARSGSSADAVAGSLRYRMTVTEAEIGDITIPTLVLSGDIDSDNGDGAALASMFPNGDFVSVPGDHLSVLGTPDYAVKAAAFAAQYRRP